MKLISTDRANELLQQFSSLAPLMVIGDVGIDKYTYGEVRRINPEAPVPVLEVTKEWPKLGLSGNITDNLASLGVSSTICSVIGNNGNANEFERLIENIGMKTWGLVRDPERRTTIKQRATTATQQVCRIDYETVGPLSQDTQSKLLTRISDLSKEHSCFIIEDYAKGVISEELVQKVKMLAKEQGKMVLVDPGRHVPPLIYQGVDLFKPNLFEAQTMTRGLGYHEDKVEKMAEVLVDKLNLKMLAMTLGGEGMAIYDRSDRAGLKIIPTITTEVFDVSGAGDTAMSVMASVLASGGSLEEAAWMANCASGVVVGKKGTATVNQAELIGYLERLTQNLNQ